MSLKDRLAAVLPASFRSYVAARTGSYRAVVGPPGEYDTSGASQFNLLTLLGLREHHSLLDIGCGSLRAGRLFIPFLQPGRYFGIEPQRWLVEAALRTEVGRDVVRRKRPTFDHGSAFDLCVFGRPFDMLLASSIFSHASQSQIAACLGEARLVMHEESLLLASFHEGPADHEGDGWTYPGMVAYTFERLESLARERGLSCERIDWPYVYGARRQVWVAFRRLPAAAR